MTTVRWESGSRRESFAELDGLVQRIAEIFDSRQRYNDSVAATIDLLDNPQEPPPRILSQIEREMFPFDSDAMIL
jgi:hypothetical protein